VLGGGGVIFCKSGKDRTGMGATLREQNFLASSSRDVVADDPQDLHVLRRFGTRLAVCEKNVGRPKYVREQGGFGGSPERSPAV
jgi:hypothetical protein